MASFFLSIVFSFGLQAEAGSQAEKPKPEQQTNGHATILAYHHVSESTPASTSISPAKFREHMQYLKDNHTVIALDTLVNMLKTDKPIPDMAVAITFDDGFVNILHNGHPIMQEFGFPYTIFVNPSKVGSNKSQLNWEELKHLSSQGVLIANHYWDHRHLLQASREADWLDVTQNHILQAEAEIKKHIGSTPGFLAYPFGEYNLALLERVKEMGIIAFAQHSGGVGAFSDLGQITRFPAAGIYASMNSLKVKLSSLNMPVIETSITDPAFYDIPAVNYSLKLDMTDFRAGQFNCFLKGEPADVNWNGNKVTISSEQPLKPGRSRVNCTAPSINKPGRFYWHSQPFFVATEDGRWLD